MAYAKEIVNQVQFLRAKGKTYSEILRETKIKVPKSTLSKWCENVSLPDWYWQKVQLINHKSHSKALRLLGRRIS